MIKWIKQNREVIFIFVITILFSIFFSRDTNFTTKFLDNGLNGILLPVFGVLIGSLITAYTIIIAFSNQIPKKVKETKAYKRINLHFLLTLLSLLILIVTSTLFYFIDGQILFLINLFLMSFSFLMFFYLILIIFMLVKIINKNN